MNQEPRTKDGNSTAFWAAMLILGLVLCVEREAVRAALSPLDWVDLPIHETGHLVFQLLGNRFIYVAGGTIGQLLMPIAFWRHFRNGGQPRSADACLLWVGQNFLGCALIAYAATDILRRTMAPRREGALD